MKKAIQIVSICLLYAHSAQAQQWTPQVSNINPNNYVQFIDAVDTNVVWGLSSSRTGQTNPVQEFTRTVDGGNSWVAGTINNAANHGPSSIMALNADTAWVAMFNVAGGGTILRTNDGGANWTPQTTATFAAPSGFPNIVHFFNANDGICMGDPNGGYFEIYTTNNGGTNWVRVPQANIAANQTGEFGITDVFTSVGDSTLYFGTNQGRIYKTTNRGQNWTAAATPYSGFLGAITFKDANFGIACEADLATTSTDLIYTNDGGSTWNLLPTNASGFTLKQSVRYVPGTDSTFVITSPYTIFGSAFSVDNGTNWKLMDNLIHSDCEFVNATTGWSGGGEVNGPIYKWTGPLNIATNDAASLTINVGVSTGISQQSPTATFINNGLSTQTFNVTMNITGGYTSTKTVSTLAYNQTQQIVFDPWTPAATGVYTVTVYTQLGTDSDLLNDTINKTVTVYNEFLNYGWTARQPVLNPKFGVASAYVNVQTYPNDSGFVFSTGGADLAGGGLVGTHDKFYAQGNSWTAGAPMPTGKYQFCMHTVKGTVYAIGGYSGGFTPDGSNYIYDYTTDTWSMGTPMPIPVGDYASGVYADSLIYFIGGFDGASDVNDVQIYNPSTDSWSVGTTKAGTATSGLRGSITGDKIVITGGFSQTLASTVDDSYLGQIDAVNPGSVTWIPIAAYPGGTISRFASGATFAGNSSLVLFTGGDPTGAGAEVKADLWAYDVIQNQWLIGPHKPTAVSNISNFTGALYNDSLYMVAVAGYDGVGTSSANEWLNMGPSPFVGIKDISSNISSLLVYPNPATQQLTIVKPTGIKTYTIKLFNAQGAMVWSQPETLAEKINIDVKPFNNGIYFILLTDQNNKVLTAKLSIKK